jgi:hypothetical protein
MLTFVTRGWHLLGALLGRLRQRGMDGISRSPTDLPADRAQIADDRLGQRGKVMKIVWQAGDKTPTAGPCGSSSTARWSWNAA